MSNVEWSERMAQWRAIYRRTQDIADRIHASKSERGWRIAESVGIGRCGCSLHNASIANIGEGWGCDTVIDGRRVSGREVIKGARRALRLINDYTEYRIAERISQRAWDRLIRGAD